MAMNFSYLLLLLIIPIVWPIIAKYIWQYTITWQEMGLQILIGCLATAAVFTAGMYSQTADREIWNGQVVSKSKEKVSCEHSYRCHCHQTCTGTGSNRSCSEECDTCYEHSFDIDWDLQTSLDSTITIDRVDRQGLDEPPRWTSAKIGDPVAETHQFTNYVKGAPDSLFNLKITEAKKKYAQLIPQYPSEIYDYHYVDRVIAVKVNVPDLPRWNQNVADILRTLGPSKQANIVIVFVGIADEDYVHALEGAWLGGKKNDIIVVVGAPSYPQIEWVRVISWTKAELFKIQLQDDLMGLKTVDREKFMGIIEGHTKASFVRRNMKDFEYLKSSVEPPLWAVIAAIVMSILCSIGLTYYFNKEDVC